MNRNKRLKNVTDPTSAQDAVTKNYTYSKSEVDALISEIKTELGNQIDNDGDGYRWFEECDDTRYEVAPNRSEQWNGRDDDCDGFIDENVDRQQHIAQSPSNTSLVLNATADSLVLMVELNLTDDQMEQLNISYIWWTSCF